MIHSLLESILKLFEICFILLEIKQNKMFACNDAAKLKLDKDLERAAGMDTP